LVAPGGSFALRGDCLEGAAEIARRHADRLRLGVRFDRLAMPMAHPWFIIVFVTLGIGNLFRRYQPSLPASLDAFRLGICCSAILLGGRKLSDWPALGGRRRMASRGR
jgi:hypothetical protein